jgi:hypothetical protein
VEDDGLVCTVSTVKDTPQRVRAFTEANLSAGADHMFVFLDQPDRDVQAALAGSPHLTVVPTGRTYWESQRPEGLTQRQQVNANLANVVLTVVPRARWLFHLDADECLHLDRSRLMALEPAVDVVRLLPWEAVSRVHWEGRVTRYKRPLDANETALLEMLGVLGTSSPGRSYFRGHVRGKMGMRPHLGRKLAIHRVHGLDGKAVDAFTADWLHMLHDESHSGEEFIRKWLTWIAHAGTERHGPHRQRLQSAITAVAANASLDEAGRRELLMELFVRHVKDDEEVLDRLGFLEEPDPEWHRHQPSTFTPEDAGVVMELLELLRPVDVTYFKRGDQGRPPRELLTTLRRELDSRRGLDERLRTALAR